MALVKSKSDTYRVAVTLLDIFFGSSLFPRGWIFCTGNRQEFNQGKKVIIIPITVTYSFSNFDFIVESFKLAGTYLMFCMIDKSRQSFFFNFRKMN